MSYILVKSFIIFYLLINLYPFKRDEGYTERIPKDCPKILGNLMQMCWNRVPKARPDFKRILDYLRTKFDSLGQSAPVKYNYPVLPNEKIEDLVLFNEKQPHKSDSETESKTKVRKKSQKKKQLTIN
eukprot:TRINITY_DN3884_c0_g2_i1.p1 TRINITY_DN3884_c0_g2~~TRINITY_DN3884_c0_g2_i1.p1  ORF type:complete len:127 (+),score=15.31 TRINITY_DN3884_c0_g2_i1:451-831(+)